MSYNGAAVDFELLYATIITRDTRARVYVDGWVFTFFKGALEQIQHVTLS